MSVSFQYFARIILCAIILLSFPLVPNLAANDSKTQIRTKIEVLQLAPRLLQSYSTYVGNLKPVTKAGISSEIAGVVDEITVEQGMHVKKGDLLIKIDTQKQLLTNQLNKSNYELALQDYERENKLLEKKLSTPAKVAALKNNLEVTRLRYELSELDLARSSIKAPIAGRISQLEIEIGEYVRVGTKLLDILDLSSVLGVLNIPEREIRFVKPDKKVVVTVDALPGETFNGYVKTIGLEADRQSRTFQIEVLLENPDAKLLPGMLIRAEMLKISLPNQIIIPRYTVQEEERGSFVYVVNNSTIHKRNIKLGASENQEVQVLSGLNPGEFLVETGQQLVTDQEAVDVIAIKKQ